MVAEEASFEVYKMLQYNKELRPMETHTTISLSRSPCHRRLPINQGVGANRPMVAQAALHVPRAALHARMAGGAAGSATPMVKPAAA